MRSLDAFLAAFERNGPDTLVALGEAALHERDRDLVLSLRRLEANLAQATVDLFDRGIELLIDRFVIGFAADGGAIELLAIEEGDHRVLELHPRHFARERHGERAIEGAAAATHCPLYEGLRNQPAAPATMR